MIISSNDLRARFERDADDPKKICLVPGISDDNGNFDQSTGVDLRLGRWFLTLRQSRVSKLPLKQSYESLDKFARSGREYFVPFGKSFILHPGRFVLGITLEWMRLPSDVAAYVTGKSSLGRSGLIIETASGIQSGFSGCLALEMTNVGEIPLEIYPGMKICQLFFHATSDESVYDGSFGGTRKPRLRPISPDSILESLREKQSPAAPLLRF
ncbi:dCTP deaminase [Candidatus Phaeomarinobacter ectocarpi]|uniref:dCTP deaminase n=1 Tax=Candidatus Phaeomarinibacter ectocarpi TaxID=1458461 RepID=UPI0014947552